MRTIDDDAIPSLPGLERPDWISPCARIIIKGKNDESTWGEALMGERRLAQLNWAASGRLVHEKPLDADGEGHGIEIQRDNSGRIIWSARWVHGKMHGPAIQFDERGRPLLVTHFARGRGTDIWMNCGKVTEIRELEDGQLHGLVRWGDPEKPSEEGCFFRGQRHGIFREWKPDGNLRKGFPRFYIKDARVARRVYMTAQAKDPSLPQYDPRDNSDKRTTPNAVRESRDRAKELRRELKIIERVRQFGG